MNETKYLVISDYVSGVCTIIPILFINPSEDSEFDYENYIFEQEEYSDNCDWFIGTLNFK